MPPQRHDESLPEGYAGLFGRAALDAWCLDPGVTFLNHGSFGATPRVVLAAQRAWQDRLERQPVQFMVRELGVAIRSAADRLARFLGGSGDDLAFVDNATTGVNVVLGSLRWESGDEILFTDHTYGGVRRAIAQTCRRYGAVPVEAAIPLPVTSGIDAVESIVRGVSARTRLVVVDHVTSVSALVLPIASLVACCRERGVAVLVDGAHAPGMVPLSLDALGADFYAANCHKWLFAPKGSGFLWVRPDRQALIEPLVTSWGWEDGFPRAFDWPGTRDFSAWLAIETALDFFEQVPREVRFGYQRALIQGALRDLSAAWQAPVAGPDDMLAAMAAVALPVSGAVTQADADRWHDRLIDEHAIEVPVQSFQDRLWLRVSAQAYNEPGDYARLRDAVLSMSGRGG